MQHLEILLCLALQESNDNIPEVDIQRSVYDESAGKIHQLKHVGERPYFQECFNLSDVLINDQAVAKVHDLTWKYQEHKQNRNDYEESRYIVLSPHVSRLNVAALLESY